jgi:hypothetical protein
MAVWFAQSLGMAVTLAGGTMLTVDAQPVNNRTGNSLRIMAVDMFGSTTIHCFWFFHTATERQVAIKQGLMTAFLNWWHDKVYGFHSSVIIANQ